MATPPETAGLTPVAAGVDTNGIDRAQIRQMLDLVPEDRLRRMEEFLRSALELRELNEERSVR
jgi:hypothetical protein